MDTQINADSQLGNEWLNVLVDSAPVGMCIVDAETGKFIRVNQFALDLIGLDHEALCQLGPGDISPELQPDGRNSEECARAYIVQALAGERVVFDWFHTNAAGELIPSEIRVSRLPHPDRKLVIGCITDLRPQKRAESVEKQADEFRRSVLDNHFDGTVLIANGVIKYANPAMESLTGRTCQTLIGMIPREVIAPEDQQRVTERIQALMDGAPEFPSEYTFQHPDGTQIPVEIRSRTIVHDDEPTLLSYVRNLTADKEQKTTLRQSEARQHLMLSQMPGINWTMDRNLVFTSSLGVGLSKLGLEPGQVVGMSIWDYFQSSDKEFRPIKMHFEALEGRSASFELTWQSRVFQCRVEPFLDENGEIVGVIGAAHDISELHEAQSAVAENESRFQQLANNVNLVFFIVAIDWSEMIYCNPAFDDIWGISRSTFYDDPKSILETVHVDDRDAFADRVRRRASGEIQGRTEFDFRIVRPDGSIRWIHSKINPIEDADGKDYRIAGTAEDITSQRQADEALRLTQFAVNNAAEAMFTVSPDGHILSANKTACERLEYTAEELTNMCIADIDPHYPAELWPGHWEELRRDGKMFIETQHQTKSGRILDVEVSIAYFEFGGVEYCCSSIRDVSKRKQTERQLQITQFTVDQATDAVFWHDLEGNLLYVNESACSSLGYSKDELLSMSVPDIDPVFAPSLFEEMIVFIKHAQSHTFESRHRRKDGSTFPVQVSIKLHNTPDGDIFSSHVRNATDSKQAENLLRLQREVLEKVAAGSTLDPTLELLARLVEQMVPGAVVAVMLLDVESRTISAVAGPSLTDEMRETFAGIVPDDKSGSCAGAVYFGRPVIATNTKTDPHWENVRDLAERFSIRACWSFPIFDANETAIGTFAICLGEPDGPTDFHRQILQTASYLAGISIQRHQAMENLWLKNQAMSSSMGAIVLGSISGNISYANKAFLDMWGIEDESQVLGRKFFEFSANPEMVLESMEAIKQNGHWTGQDVAARRDGSTFDIEISAGIIMSDDDPTPVGIMATMLDVTARNKAERRSKELLSQLAHVNRVSSMDAMATALAHEVNQPLGTIANYAGTCVDLMREGRMDLDTAMSSMQKINEQTLRAGQILARLKKYVARTVPSSNDVELNLLCSEVQQLLLGDAKLHGVTIALTLGEELPNVEGDAVQIQQVLVNLVINAIEATCDQTRDRRTIQVATHCKDGFVHLSVIDQGVGLRDDQLRSVFDPYETSKQNGLGMGLSISRRIIEAHRGTIWAEQNEKQGARFSFALPVQVWRIDEG